jgi:hypothetical protein
MKLGKPGAKPSEVLAATLRLTTLFRDPGSRAFYRKTCNRVARGELRAESVAGCLRSAKGGRQAGRGLHRERRAVPGRGGTAGGASGRTEGPGHGPPVQPAHPLDIPMFRGRVGEAIAPPRAGRGGNIQTPRIHVADLDGAHW